MPADAPLDPATGFATGTMIRTTSGEVAVEALAAADVLVTRSGRREVRDVALAGPAKTSIRVAAGAFGAGVPCRDVVLAPRHGVRVTCVDEMLAPVADLVNGATVATVGPSDVWRVILDAHDILFANDLPCESCRDGDEAPCRPACDDQRLVHAVRARLHEWALEIGWRIVPLDPDLRLEVDGATLRGDAVGDRIRFVVPASPSLVWLVSRFFVPSEMGLSSDPRRLGVQVMEIEVDDGLGGITALPVEDPTMNVGFHVAETAEAGGFRWTDGRAQLPTTLWECCQGVFFLKLRYSSQPAVRWEPPS